MQRSTILALAFLSFGALLPAACTQNFGIFEPSGGAGGSTSSSSHASASSASSTGTGMGCKADTECDDVNPCTTDTCNKSTGKCSNVNVPDGPVPGSMDTTKDCKADKCVAGTKTSVADDADVPDNMNPCVTLSCSMSNVVTTNVTGGMVPGCNGMQKCDGMGNCTGCKMDSDCPGVGDCQKQHCDVPTQKCNPTNDMPGTSCNSSGGKVCDGAGACVHCNNDGDCAGPPEICVSHTCGSSCGDGVKNGDETDKDCGGSCPKCVAGKMCGDGGDCKSGVCTGNVCQAPTCNDGVQNGNETDTDCGGGTCPKCANGMSCLVPGDCTSGDCAGGMCIDQCTDGVKNGLETDVDCGGGTCPKCVNSKMCSVASDCMSGDCYHTGGGAGQKTCHGDLCSDGVKDGTETGIDCGGACPANCADGMGCMNDGDCMNGFCKASICTLPTCTDAALNGNETDVDCGGTGFKGAAACSKCADGKICGVNADCTNDTCIGQLCYPASCGNGVVNAPETDVDCGGGTCPKCGNMKTCAANSDCLSNNCNLGAHKCM